MPRDKGGRAGLARFESVRRALETQAESLFMSVRSRIWVGVALSAASGWWSGARAQDVDAGFAPLYAGIAEAERELDAASTVIATAAPSSEFGASARIQRPAGPGEFELGGTGSKMNVPLREIPATVNVIDQATLRERGIVDHVKALELLPGVVPQWTYGGFQYNQIRGFQALTLFDGRRDSRMIQGISGLGADDRPVRRRSHRGAAWSVRGALRLRRRRRRDQHHPQARLAHAAVRARSWVRLASFVARTRERAGADPRQARVSSRRWPRHAARLPRRADRSQPDHQHFALQADRARHLRLPERSCPKCRKPCAHEASPSRPPTATCASPLTSPTRSTRSPWVVRALQESMR
jgi:hypothetical protein